MYCIGGVVAVMLRYPALSSPLVLLLRVPGDTHPERHVIVYVSRDEVSYLPWKFSFYFFLGRRSIDAGVVRVQHV